MQAGLRDPCGKQEKTSHTAVPARARDCRGWDTASGLFYHAVTNVRLKRKEQDYKSALLCHQPGWGLRWVWALPLEGIWDHSQLCVFPQLGGGACAPVPGRPTPQPPPRRPQTCVSFSLGFMVLARSWEPHESKPHKQKNSKTQNDYIQWEGSLGRESRYRPVCRANAKESGCAPVGAFTCYLAPEFKRGPDIVQLNGIA